MVRCFPGIRQKDSQVGPYPTRTSREFALLTILAYLMSVYGDQKDLCLAGIGSTLRSARESRGLTIELAAQETRISPRFLEALEDDRFEALPAPVYVRGFLRSYANYLHVDANPLMKELNARQGSPVAGPDGFVSGPVVRAPSRDPWRQRPQAGAHRTATGVAPEALQPPPPIGSDWAPDPADDESWAPEPLNSAEVRQAPWDEPASFQPPVEPVEQDLGPEEEEYRPPQETYRSRRVAGVLVEREAEYNDAGGPMRFIALAGAGLIALVFFAVVGILLAGGGDDDSSAGAGDNGVAGSPTTRAGTQVAVASVTPTTLTATVSPDPSPAATETGTPVNVTPTGTTGTPSPTAQPTAAPTQRPGDPTPTSTSIPPTATPEPPTPTPVPPTPRPPTPVPTPVIAHPSGTSECSQFGGACGRPGPGGTALYLVVCAPDGWFIDAPANGDFTADGGTWPRRTATSIPGASSVCG